MVGCGRGHGRGCTAQEQFTVLLKVRFSVARWLMKLNPHFFACINSVTQIFPRCIQCTQAHESSRDRVLYNNWNKGKLEKGLGGG